MPEKALKQPESDKDDFEQDLWGAADSESKSARNKGQFKSFKERTNPKVKAVVVPLAG